MEPPLLLLIRRGLGPTFQQRFDAGFESLVKTLKLKTNPPLVGTVAVLESAAVHRQSGLFGQDRCQVVSGGSRHGMTQEIVP